MALSLKKIIVLGLLCFITATSSIDPTFEKRCNACTTSAAKTAFFCDEINKGIIPVNDLTDFFLKKYVRFTKADASTIAEALLATYFLQLDDPVRIVNLLSHSTHENYKKMWAKKLLKKTSLVTLLTNRLTKGPLFSSYSDRHACQLLNEFYIPYTIYLESIADSSLKLKKLTEMLTKLADFTEAEYKKGNIVLFHGQQSQWPFLERWFNELCAIKYGVGAPQQFVRLRFTQKIVLTDQQVQEIRRDGVTDTTYAEYRPKVLFSNLHVLANDAGSNSLLYVAGNYDQIVYNSEHSVITDPLQKIFKEFGFTQEYKKLMREDEKLFELLYELYNELVKEQGNIGRLIAFSLPQSFAKELVYSTTIGGPLCPIKINGKLTTDVVEIAQYFDQVPFANEYCIILSKEITNPAEAYKAQIKMMTFDALDRSSEAYTKYSTQFKALSDKVAALYQELHPEMAEKIKANIKNCIGVAASRVAAAA